MPVGIVGLQKQDVGRCIVVIIAAKVFFTIETDFVGEGTLLVDGNGLAGLGLDLGVMTRRADLLEVGTVSAFGKEEKER